VERFGAALFTWNGGSNYTDNPVVRVQREAAPGQWEDYADQSGELPVTLEFPKVDGDLAPYLLGDQQWHWTAHFEAFVSGDGDRPFDTGDRPVATPAGSYRFVIDGKRREGGQVVDYEITSDEFEVSRWDGILVQDFRLEPDGTMSFTLGPAGARPVNGAGINGVGGADLSDVVGPIDYPDSYAGGDPRVARFIREQRVFARDPQAPNDPDRIEWFCFTCSFRPWIDFGDADSAKVTVTLANGSTEVVDASRQGERWITTRVLGEGETAQVRAGDVLDPYGNTNQASALLTNGTAPPAGVRGAAQPGPTPPAGAARRCKKRRGSVARRGGRSCSRKGSRRR
jgi:hypothetical protein